MFFTRLPFWRIAQVPSESFKHVVPYWPVAGWLTGGIMAGVFWLCAQVFPVSVAWLLAIVSRLLVTGCLHEDGLADFCDGFGGGTTRERILAIMKDSHIGTYGVIGLVVYFLLLYQACNLPVRLLCGIIVAADCWSKACASNIINALPYCRREEDAKIKTTYDRMTQQEKLLALVSGGLPLLLFVPRAYWWAALAPLVLSLMLFRLMRRRIDGYTGDCCGATFLTGELSFYLTCLALYFYY